MRLLVLANAQRPPPGLLPRRGQKEALLLYSTVALHCTRTIITPEVFSLIQSFQSAPNQQFEPCLSVPDVLRVNLRDKKTETKQTSSLPASRKTTAAPAALPAPPPPPSPREPAAWI